MKQHHDDDKQTIVKMKTKEGNQGMSRNVHILTVTKKRKKIQTKGAQANVSEV